MVNDLKLEIYINGSSINYIINQNILLTKTTATQNEVALSYHRARGLYLLVVVSAGTIVGWVGVTVDTFSENGTVLSYKLTECNHMGDGNIWEFCLTDAHFYKFHSAS